MGERTWVSEAILEDAADMDIYYEVDQYCRWSTLNPSNGEEHWDQIRLSQATFECAVVHLRCLATFLTRSRPKKGTKYETDLVAEHYFVDLPAWERPDPFPMYSRTDDAGVEENINRHLAHITTQRHTQRQINNPFTWGDVEPTLVLGGFLAFITALPPDRQAWFKRAHEKAAVTLPKLRYFQSVGFMPLAAGTTAEYDPMPRTVAAWRTDGGGTIVPKET